MLFKSLIFISIFLLGCDPGTKEIRRSKAQKKTLAELQASASLTSSAVLSIKNCEQILRAMEKITGVSRLSGDVNKVYLNVEGSCPQDSKPDSFDAAQMVAVNKIALEFCGVYVDQAAAKGSIKDLDLNKSPELAFTDTALASLYQTFYSQFWMGPRQGIPPFENMKKELDSLVNELRKTGNKTPAATKAITQGLCAAVLGAAPVIIQ